MTTTPTPNTVPDLHQGFHITSVSRADLLDVGFTLEQVNALSDHDMDHLARKMADDYIQQMFWSSMEILAEFELISIGVDPTHESREPGDEEDDDEWTEERTNA